MIFLRMLYRSFAMRVALLALVSGLLVLLGVIVLLGSLSSAPTQWKMVLVASVIIGLPLVVGWLTSRLVMRPLRSFTEAIVALQASNYKAKLVPSGIVEFDQVQHGFNDLAARLHREEELRKNLISDTSHELNTPLTVMGGQLTAMQEGRLSLTKERIGILKEQTDRLTELVAGLDAYARARMPQVAPLDTIDVADLCKQAVDECRPALAKASIRPILDIPEGLTVQANRQAFCQILINLLQNTVRYSDATEVRIAASKQRLTVSDNGKGIPTEHLPHIFERFYRVEPSRNKSTGGLGLGLAIVHELAEGQGWTIRAKAAKPGVAFIIDFNA